MKEHEIRPEAEGLIEGRNAVAEALRSGAPVDKLYIAKGETDRTLGRLAAAARKAGVVVVEADRRKLDAMSATHSHQGVIAIAAAQAYASVEDILQTAAERGEAPLLVVCDEISDPHNLGAIIRTAEEELGYKIVERRHGGKNGGAAYVTERGKKLLYKFERYEEQVEKAALELFEDIFLGTDLF